MRGRLLKLGLAQEARLESEPQPGDQWLLINSLGCRPLRSVNGQPLEVTVDAELLWRQLLESNPASAEAQLQP
jgi:4-amino-4-deoxychorismate lyase